MIGVLGSLAEYERELTKERTALKRAASRANGTKFGRPRKVDDTEHIATAKRMKAGIGPAVEPGIRGCLLRLTPGVPAGDVSHGVLHFLLGPQGSLETTPRLTPPVTALALL
jgi:hypothetical protein